MNNFNDVNTKSVIEAFSKNIAVTGFEDLDKATITSDKNRFIDVPGCLIRGVNAPGNSARLKLERSLGGKRDPPSLSIMAKGRLKP